MPAKRTDIDIDSLVKMYVDGVSEKKLSNIFKFSRTGIRPILIAAGVDIRGRSDANRLKMSQMTPEQRRANVAAAHAARHAKGEDPASTEKRIISRAIGNQLKTWQVGGMKGVVFEMLRGRGLDPVPQYPVRGYNIDLALPPVAVEIHTAVNHPLADKRNRKRTIYLLNAGWSVLYVWIDPKRSAFTNDGAQEVVTFVDAMRRDEPHPRQYRVIRGNGDLVSTGGGNTDDFTDIVTRGGGLRRAKW